MSKFYKARRAAQAKGRRARKSKELKVLQQRASAPGASSSLKKEYHVAFERHTKLLQTGRERVATWRKNLAINIKKGIPNALAKAKQNKEAKKASDLRRKKNGQMRKLKYKQRSARKIKYIEENLQQQNINGF